MKDSQTTQEALNAALKDAQAWKAAALAAQAERDSLAAQNEIMRSSLELAFISVRSCYKQDLAPFKDVTTVEKAIKLTPLHCLAEIRAEAGRAGFIAGAATGHAEGYDYGLIRGENPTGFDFSDEADQYAEQIRQGGAA